MQKGGSKVSVKATRTSGSAPADGTIANRLTAMITNTGIRVETTVTTWVVHERKSPGFSPNFTVALHSMATHKAKMRD
jgi:hypothetical protein